MADMITPAERAKLRIGLQGFFNPETDFDGDFEERDRRDVASYIPYRYAPGWFAEDPGSNWWNAEWATRRRWEIAQYDVQFQGLRPQYVHGNEYPSSTYHGLPFANYPAFGHRAQSPVVPRVPARTVAHGQSVVQTTTAPAASNPVVSIAPQIPGVLPSNTTQPAQLPAAPQAVHNPPTLPPHLQIPLAQRPTPPAGFNDQPPARIPVGSYLNLKNGRPGRVVQWPTGIEISIVEICTFCPDWFQNPDVIARAIRNGWSREALAKVQLLAEDPLTRSTFERRHGRIQKQISDGGKLIDGRPKESRFNSEDFRRRHGPQNDLTADAWTFKQSYDNTRHAYEYLGDMPLSAFYTQVVNWPTGNDRLLMTQCLEFARQNPGRQLDTSHWDWIISSQNLTAPPALPNSQHRDVEALDRVNLLANPVP